MNQVVSATQKHNGSINSKKMRLLILCPSQFGYHLSTYYYCRHGRKLLDITYMGFKGSRPSISMEEICIKVISNRGNKFFRALRWYWNILKESRKGYDLVFIKYFMGCSLLRIVAPNRRFILDICTGSIQQGRWQRRLADISLLMESKIFANISIISENLARKLGIRDDRYHILPLGADVMTVNEKQYDALHLLYVGTLSGREIEKTIIGFERFCRRHRDSIALTSYTIAGDGYRGELERLRLLVIKLGLESVVNILGYVHHIDMAVYWERCNVGVSFVPINYIYDCQPATKTFEYLLAGMPTIATGTKENKLVINNENGVIIDDTATSFEQGLEEIYLKRGNFSSIAIKRTAEGSQWERIVRCNLYPYLITVNDRRK
jgi:glycosyltransferase involved in cell wall biosynthesis